MPGCGRWRMARRGPAVGTHYQYGAVANVSEPYVGVPVAYATVLWIVDTASEVMVVGGAAYNVARVRRRTRDAQGSGDALWGRRGGKRGGGD